MWKQGKRQPNSFAPTKQQNNNYRRNNTRSQGSDNQDRQNRGDRNHNSARTKRPQTYNRNQTLDSQGPEIKVRGTLSQITEKYVTLARDATISGDRILAENLLQHAEHYARILNEIAPPVESKPQPQQAAQPSVNLAEQPQPKIDPAQMPQPPVLEAVPKPSQQEPTPIADIVIPPRSKPATAKAPAKPDAHPAL